MFNIILNQLLCYACTYIFLIPMHKCYAILVRYMTSNNLYGNKVTYLFFFKKINFIAPNYIQLYNELHKCSRMSYKT